MQFLEKIFDFLFPAKCSNCGNFGSYFCNNCLNQLKLRQNQEIKGVNLIKTFVIFEYRTNKSLQKLIKEIKYKNFYSKISSITNKLAEKLEKEFSCQSLILVPVPLHWRRKLQRGFNQSEEVCNSVVNAGQRSLQNTQIKNLLKRNKNTPHQASLDKIGRLENMKEAFKINGIEKLGPKVPIILVDDISTTGETLENCARELKKHYKNPIYGLVIASDKK